MKKFDWKPSVLTGKPDFYTVLKRRKRTLEEFLSASKIKNYNDLASVFSVLEMEFVISDETVEKGLNYINSVSKSTLDSTEASTSDEKLEIETETEPKKRKPRKSKEN